MKKIKINDCIKYISDYHANGSYENLKENVTLKHDKNYAVMIRTLNFERNDFQEDLLYIDKDEYEYLSKSKVYADDILINKIANPGSVYLMPNLDTPVSCGMNLFVLRFDDNIVNQKYMFYNMKNREQYIKSLAHGTTTKTITKDDVRGIELFIHTREEQDQIAKLLSTIDFKISNNEAIVQQLESMAKTIYDYWFLQFEFPNEEGNPYKSSGGKMVWNEELQREIPTGWEVASLANNSLTKLIKPGIKEFNGTKRYLATADVNGTAYSIGSNITFDNRESRANMQPTLNSIWFAKMKDSVKHLYLNKELNSIIKETILSTGFCGIQCDEYSFEYLASFIESDYFEKVKDQLAHGATQQAVNNADLQSIKLVIPSEEIVDKFHQVTKGMFSLISKNKVENTYLTALRDFLLPLLMNGQVTINKGR